MNDLTYADENQQYRWPGSGSLVTSNNVPFGYYLNEVSNPYSTPGSFELDCQMSAKMAGIALGYPTIDLEMTEYTFYMQFENAVNEYAAQVNEFNIRNNMLSLQGSSLANNPNVSGINVVGSGLAAIISISKQYGSEIGVGGNVEIKKAAINVVKNQQTYDLQDLIGCGLESGSRIEIRRVFHNASPAAARLYGAYGLAGNTFNDVLGGFGFGVGGPAGVGYSPGSQFLMTPLFDDLLRIQQIEFNDMIRKSAYGFEIANNKLKLFPIPTDDHKVYIEYVLEKDKYASSYVPNSNNSVVSDYSNIPYQNITYNKINAVGKQWIKKYFIASCRETLGEIRMKYSEMPTPGNSSIVLNGAELISSAQTQKEELMTQLREALEASGKAAQSELRYNELEKNQNILKSIPMAIYIG